MVRKELRTQVQVREQLLGACGVEEQGHGHGLGWRGHWAEARGCLGPAAAAPAPWLRASWEPLALRRKPAGGPLRTGGQGGAGRGERAGPWLGLCCRWELRGISVSVAAFQEGLSTWGSVGFGTTCWAGCPLSGLSPALGGLRSCLRRRFASWQVCQEQWAEPCPSAVQGRPLLLTGPHCALTGLLGQRGARPGQSPGPVGLGRPDGQPPGGAWG